MNWQNPVERETEKRLRTVLAAFLLAMAAALAVLIAVYPKRYVPEAAVSGDSGFVALCYEGVNRKGTDGAVTPRRLREQLSALREQGYVSVGRDEVTAYREQGAALPEKALYLAFADGRGETALFADRVLRELNYRAAFLTEPSESEWDYEGLPKRQRDGYLESGFWEEGLPGFSAGTGVNLREGPLTWMQPGNDWSSNNLLMQMAAARGDRFPAQGVPGWDSLGGNLATDGAHLTLTSPAGQAGIARLQVGGEYGDWLLEVRYLGTGRQSVYLRADPKFTHFIRLTYENGTLSGTQRSEGKEDVLFSRPVEGNHFSVSLNGGELRVEAEGETVAWTRTTVKEQGYLCVEAVPDEGEKAVADGVFQMKVSRPEGKAIHQVYTTVQPVKFSYLRARNAWDSAWEWLRAAL